MPDYVLIESGDADDAENVGTVLGHPALSDYVHPNEQFTVTNIDDTNDTFDMSGGKAYIGYDGGLDTASNDTRNQLMFTVEIPGKTDIPLTNVDATNYVWLDAQVGTNDSAQWIVTDTDSQPTEASLLIVTIVSEDPNSDGSSESVYLGDYHNRGPDLIAEVLEHPETEPIELNGTTFEGAGHDAVDVPQTVERTVEDWESGTLDSWSTNSGGSNQSNRVNLVTSPVKTGDFALNVRSDNTSSVVVSASLEGKSEYIQQGDTFSSSFYLDDSLAEALIYFAVQDTYRTNNGKRAIGYQVKIDGGNIYLNVESDENTISNIDTDSVSVNSQEWYHIEGDFGKDGEITIRLYDSVDNKLGEVSGNDTTFDSGGIALGCNNEASGVSEAYFDKITLERREPEARTNTQKGTTQLGNEVVPSGGINTGPQEVPADHPNYPMVNLPVTDNLAQGEQVGYHLAINGQRGLTVEAEADGNGGTQGRKIRSNFTHEGNFTGNIATGNNTLSNGGSSSGGYHFAIIPFDDSGGTKVVSEFIHQGYIASAIVAKAEYFAISNKNDGTRIDETTQMSFNEADDDWLYSAGQTISQSSGGNLRFATNSSDNTIIELQIDRPDGNETGYVRVDFGGRGIINNKLI